MPGKKKNDRLDADKICDLLRCKFPSIGEVVSYCGLCGAQKESAEKSQRGPLSKQRNKPARTPAAAHFAALNSGRKFSMTQTSLSCTPEVKAMRFPSGRTVNPSIL